MGSIALNKRKWQPEGYMTVEASLVLPLVLGVIIFVIYFQMFWYNRCLMDQKTAVTGIKLSHLQSVRQEEIEDFMNSQIMPEETIGWKESDLYISLSGNCWKLKRQGQLILDSQRKWMTEISYKNTRLTPGIVLRAYRRIMSWEEKTA